MPTTADSMGSTSDVRDVPPSLTALPAEIIEHIALCSATGSSSDGGPRLPPCDLRSLLLTNRRMHSLLNASANPRLYARIFRSKFDVDAIGRRFGPSAVRARNLSGELAKRCVQLGRIKNAVRLGRLFPDGDNEQSRKEMEENLWLAFMMMMENDGLNIAQLQRANIDGYLLLHHSQEMLEAAFRPEYPNDKPDRALALHLQYLLFDDDKVALGSRDESDEKLFVLRPFVFAAHRFDAFYAPWTTRFLPECNDDDSVTGEEEASVNPFMADLRIRDRCQTIEHCGQQVVICPPNVTHAACYSFFLKVERDPAVTGLNDLFNIADIAQAIVGRPRSTDPDETGVSNRNPLSFVSRDHDRDLKRLLSCTSPRNSPGLKTFFHLGHFEGSWEGRFAYFDFDSYRDMLGGKLRSLYEGPFGEQAHVWKVKEHIVKLAPDEKPGGTGDALNAGYAVGDEPTLHPFQSPAETKQWLGRKDSGLPDDWHLYPTFAEDAGEMRTHDDEEDRYEILLSGTGHSAWGRFILRGRVRSWDGLLTMTKEYRPDGRGRWLYRGYAVAGGQMVGRWRDTFTPPDMCGYEGSFLLHHRGG